MENAPKVFISYSHDNDGHKQWVERLAFDLRRNGIDIILDKWDLGFGEDVAIFMENNVSAADRVLVVCTPRYVAKTNAGEGGVGYEKMIVTAELVKSIGTNKFIPLIRNSGGSKAVPLFLGIRLYVDFDNDEGYQQSLTDLARELHGRRVAEKPLLGPTPLWGENSMPQASHTTVDSVFDTRWIFKEREFASTELSKTGLRGSLEITFALEIKTDANQSQLLEAARMAIVRTFGWPIGVLIESRNEFRPRPRQDGIFASIAHKEDNQYKSYDYWAIRKDGDFYLLKSLFEDERAPNALFFDTRIVRTTEAVLYCEKLYRALGVDRKARVHFNTRYEGLRGRQLSSATPLRREALESASAEDEVEAGAVFALEDINSKLADIVESLLGPVFVLFDFFELPTATYAEIIGRFLEGKVA